MVLEYSWGRVKRDWGRAEQEGLAQEGREEAMWIHGRVLTFVFSCSSGLRAHGTAHKHSVAPVEGLIYQGYS